MRKYVPVLLMLGMFACGGNIGKYCDQAQKAYVQANAAAQAAKPVIPPDVWNSCVVPLDASANDAVVACYRAAAAGSPADIIAALADTANAFVLNYQLLQNCGITR